MIEGGARDRGRGFPLPPRWDFCVTGQFFSPDTVQSTQKSFLGRLRPGRTRIYTDVCCHYFCIDVPFLFPFFTAFALTACHLIGTVSSWALPYHPTNNTRVHSSPLHHWDFCSCCRNVASQHLLIPSITWTTPRGQMLQAANSDTTPPLHIQKKDRTCSVWTWWKNSKVWGCTEWLRGECQAAVMQSNTTRYLLRLGQSQFTAAIVRVGPCLQWLCSPLGPAWPPAWTSTVALYTKNKLEKSIFVLVCHFVLKHFIVIEESPGCVTHRWHESTWLSVRCCSEEHLHLFTSIVSWSTNVQKASSSEAELNP